MLTNGIVVDQSRLPRSALQSHPVSISESTLAESLNVSPDSMQRHPVMLSEISSEGKLHLLKCITLILKGRPSHLEILLA